MEIEYLIFKTMRIDWLFFIDYMNKVVTISYYHCRGCLRVNFNIFFIKIKKNYFKLIIFSVFLSFWCVDKKNNLFLKNIKNNIFFK
jgi:hypothetical protein